MKKGFIHIFFLVFVVLLGIGLLLFLSFQKGLVKFNNKENNPSPTPTPSPQMIVNNSNEWKTYSYNALGISFNYPTGYSVANTLSESSFCCITITKDRTTLIFHGKKGGLDGFGPYFVDKWAKSNYSESRGIFIDSITESEGDNDPDIVSVATNQSAIFNNIGVFFLISYPSNDPEAKLTIDQILSTFKFIEKTSPSSLQAVGSREPEVTPTAATQKVLDNCIVGGCSGQICSDEEVVTTCEYKEEYGCFKFAICERQNSGKCGWTETQEFLNCKDSL